MTAWVQSHFRDVRSTFLTVSGIATTLVSALGLVTALLVAWH